MARTDSASLVVNAEVQRVFAALLHPEQRREWLPPHGMTGRFQSFDPRPGGFYRLVLTYDDPRSSAGKATPDSDIVEARFLDIVPEVREPRTGNVGRAYGGGALRGCSVPDETERGAPCAGVNAEVRAKATAIATPDHEMR
jgi:hypothetical protein